MNRAVLSPTPKTTGPLSQRTSAGLFRALSIVCVALLALGGVLTSPSGDFVAAQSLPVEEITGSAPTLPGAPFLPIADRTDHVITRYETLVALDEVARAQTALSQRANSGAGSATGDAQLEETRRILAAQSALLERTVERLEVTQQALIDETSPFGVGLAVFPVDQVRKPFWNDWGRPRSGGRTHVGTDVLAQIGVPLRAIEDGVVEAISSGGNGGTGIFMIGDSGSRYYYAHMDELADLAVGERILAGQPVGTVGDTGNASGAPHLHMQWDPNGGSAWQNPYPLLDTLFGAGRTETFAEEADALLAAVDSGIADNQAELDALADSDATDAELVLSVPQ